MRAVITQPSLLPRCWSHRTLRLRTCTVSNKATSACAQALTDITDVRDVPCRVWPGHRHLFR